MGSEKIATLIIIIMLSHQQMTLWINSKELGQVSMRKPVSICLALGRSLDSMDQQDISNLGAIEKFARPIVNFNTRKIVKVRTSWPKHFVIKKKLMLGMGIMVTYLIITVELCR